MKTVHLQITDAEGTVVKEQTLELQEGSTVVVKMPDKYMANPEMIDMLADAFSHLGDGHPIFLPEDINFVVVNVKE